MLKRVGKVVVGLVIIVGVAGIAGVVFTWGLRTYILRSADGRIYPDLERLLPQQIAIVFGAGVWPSGQLSDVLADRVDTAVDLYRAGKVHKLLMTGDNRFEWYNEPGAMGEYAISRGMPAADIVYDYAGRRTYDSCYRAKHIFGIDEAVLVTQKYHLPRALYTCREIGIDVVGVPADRRPYRQARYFAAREIPAILVAWWETQITHPLPVMGDRIEIEYE